MGFGFKRLVDLSSLSIKQLNDQLEQIWLKVMGGIGQRDLDQSLQKTISSKVSEEDFSSLIEQNAKTIQLAVGRSHGENLVKNPCAALGLSYWTCTSRIEARTDHVGPYFYLAGNMVQTGIRINGGQPYAYGFEYVNPKTFMLEVWGQYAGEEPLTKSVLLDKQTLPVAETATQYVKELDIPEGVHSMYIRLVGGVGTTVRYIYANRGDSLLGYTPNPNELAGSGIAITEDMVNISTPNFRLELTKSSGEVSSVVSADANGFSNLVCDQLTIGGRQFGGRYPGAIYVDPDAGRDTYDGMTRETAVKTIYRALSMLPLFMEDSATIYLGGHTYYEDIVLNHGGTGNVVIQGENAIIYGSIRITSYSGNMAFYRIQLYSNDGIGIKCSAASCCTRIEDSLIDCNGVSGSVGVTITNGARGTMMVCEINNCDQAILIEEMGLASFYDCIGNGNAKSILCQKGGFLIGDGFVPFATGYITDYAAGGQIYADIIATEMGSRYTPPGDGVKLYQAHAVNTATTIGGEWKENTLIQGMWKYGNVYTDWNCGVIFFDRQAVVDAMAGKEILSIDLIVRRRESGPNVSPVTISLWKHRMTAPGDAYQVFSKMGKFTTARVGETVRIPMDSSVITDFQNGVMGYCLYDTEKTTSQYAEFCPLSEFATRMEIRYK